MLVRQVMTTDPVTVRAGTTVKVALRLLDENDISSLPVTDEHGRVCGVVSEAGAGTNINGSGAIAAGSNSFGGLLSEAFPYS